MPRKPNYQFERSQRTKRKAERKQERLQAKADKTAERKQPEEGDTPAGDQE